MPSCKVPFLAEHSSRTHALVSKVESFAFIAHHFRSFIILDSDSIFLPLYHFIYYKNPMYTTFSVVESNPPLTTCRRRPVLFSSPPVVAHPAHEKHPVRVHVHARSFYARPVQLTRSIPVHVTTHTFNPPFLPFIDYVQRPSQTTTEILALPFAQLRESFIRFSDQLRSFCTLLLTPTGGGKTAISTALSSYFDD